MINWNEIETAHEDFEMIIKIAVRALERLKTEKVNIVMDLQVVHHFVGLKLAELFEADDLNFFHDLVGIHHHLDRHTGILRNCFVPRYSKSKEVCMPSFKTVTKRVPNSAPYVIVCDGCQNKIRTAHMYVIQKINLKNGVARAVYIACDKTDCRHEAESYLERVPA